MGTTLTGNKIKDTYKSLVKLSDSGEAGSTGKQLSDGNGNDLGLFVDTDGAFGVGSSPSFSLDISGKTDGIALPVGTTANRPTGSAGIIRYNNTTSVLEYFDTAFKKVASQTYVNAQVNTAITNLIDGAPATLDTLNELAAALNDDDAFHTTITNLIATKQATITGAATTITGTDLTASKALVSDSNGKVSVSVVSNTELGYLTGVTSSIQTQIDAKHPTITGAATTITTADLTVSRAVISNASGKVAVSSVTDTELGYVSGVTSSIQNQFNSLPSTANTILVTVVAVSGSNYYFIDGTRQQSLQLIAGVTYRLDQSATTPSPGNSGHPLKFSTTSDGTHGGGTEYTTGVTYVGTPGTAGAYTQIIPEQDTPKLYYYCSIHSGMGGEVIDPRVSGGVSSVALSANGTSSSGNPLTITPTTGAVTVASNAFAGGANVGHVPTAASAATGTFLKKDGTWAVPAGSGGGGGGAGTLDIEQNRFNGDGSTVAFTVTSSVVSKNNLQVFIDGVYQSKDNFGASGTTLTFTTAPATGTNNIEVIHLISVIGSIKIDEFTGDGSDVTFDLSSSISTENNTQVFIDGVYQSKDNYSTSGVTITFTTAPPNTSAIEVVHIVPNGSGGGTDWQSAIKTANFTASAGEGYFVNTTSSTLTVTLPVGVVGTEILLQDYAGTFATNKIILAANGSEKIQGVTDDSQIAIKNATTTLIYQDATRGWTAQNLSLVLPALNVFHLTVGGGAAGGKGSGGGGGGAGEIITNYGATALLLTVGTNYALTVGASGAASSISTTRASNGNNSIFSVFTAIGGGAGGSESAFSRVGANGASGGGGGYNPAAGGNGTGTKGKNGGQGGIPGNQDFTGGGGGGFSSAGQNAPGSGDGGNGGAGASNSITGTALFYAGGGGGGSQDGSNAGTPGTGGAGGGGTGMAYSASFISANNAEENTGGGGGGGNSTANLPSGIGGSGVVILRYPSGYALTIPGTLASTTTLISGIKITKFTAGTGDIQFN